MAETKPIMRRESANKLRDEDGKEKTGMSRRGILVAVGYMTCAVLLVMFNKAALSSYNFPHVNIITLLQMMSSNVILYVLRSSNVITFSTDSLRSLEESGASFVPMRTLRKAAPLSISYLFYMVVGMASIRGVNVPMYTALRRTTVVFTMSIEHFLVGTVHPPDIVASVCVIVVGAIVAGFRDMSFDLTGYSLVFLSNFTTAAYLATIAKLGKSTHLNSFGLMWCNGVICMPILLVWSILSGELNAALNFPQLRELPFQMVMFMSCTIAFCLNYTIFLNTSLNSALTQTMCGNLKDLGTVALGWILFGGLPFDWLNVVGQMLGFLGSGMYAYFRLRGR